MIEITTDTAPRKRRSEKETFPVLLAIIAKNSGEELFFTPRVETGFHPFSTRESTLGLTPRVETGFHSLMKRESTPFVIFGCQKVRCVSPALDKPDGSSNENPEKNNSSFQIMCYIRFSCRVSNPNLAAGSYLYINF